MKRKTSLNIKKRVFAGIAISALALAVAGGVNFATNANAATGTDTTKAEYGEQLKDQPPASLTDATWVWYTGDKRDWTWVDAGTNYFGKPTGTGTRTLVAKNADGTAYDTVTFPVQRRNVTPLVKQGSASAYSTTSAANYVTDNPEANISTYKKAITVTAGEGGTASINTPSASGDEKYVIGQSIEIEAIPSTGYSFVKWSDGDDSNPRTITVNGDATYTATFEEDSMKVTSALPTKFGDVSIMTLEQAYVALGGSTSETKSIWDSSYGYNTSTYYMYAINDTAGTNDALTNSTSTNLQAVGTNWYNELNKPTTSYDHWTVGSHKLFGGPLLCVSREGADAYTFGWFYSEQNYNTNSNNLNEWNSIVSGSVYVAVVNTANTMSVTSELPTNLGDVSIMTLDQAYVALGGTINSDGYQFDPTVGYNSSTYYIYAINDTPGTNDATTKSTSDNLQAVGIDWYKKLNKPTTANNHWTVGSHKLFGGPLGFINYSDYYERYSLCWYRSGDNSNCHSGRSDYWYDFASGSAYVAVVKAANTDTSEANVSIMTIKQAYNILGASPNLNYDVEMPAPNKGYNSSTFYVYGIVGSGGNNSTSANLQAVDLDWYKQKNKLTSDSENLTFSSNGKTVFGGPLYSVTSNTNGTYNFKYYRSESNYICSNWGDYWNKDVSGSVYVAVVH